MLGCIMNDARLACNFQASVTNSSKVMVFAACCAGVREEGGSEEDVVLLRREELLPKAWLPACEKLLPTLEVARWKEEAGFAAESPLNSMLFRVARAGRAVWLPCCAAGCCCCAIPALTAFLRKDSILLVAADFGRRCSSGVVER